MIWLSDCRIVHHTTGRPSRLLQARAIPGVEYVSASQYIRTIEIDRVHGVVVEATNGHALQLAIRFPRLASLPVIIERVRRIFDRRRP
jgi:AraC family transcriptional regulator of adaptative response / DNA-3-methyladenine glycosylase II